MMSSVSGENHHANRKTALGQAATTTHSTMVYTTNTHSSEVGPTGELQGCTNNE